MICPICGGRKVTATQNFTDGGTHPITCRVCKGRGEIGSHVVVQMPYGEVGEVKGVYGPFNTKADAEAWIPKTDDGYLYTINEVTEPSGD